MERGEHAYSFSVRKAEQGDIPLLAWLNRALIEDEGSRNPMTFDALAERMAEFLKDGWQADLFCRANEVLGYALYQIDKDGYEDAPFVYIRQFFIKGEHRRQGYGLQAVEYLIKYAFPPGAVYRSMCSISTRPGAGFGKRRAFRPTIST